MRKSSVSVLLAAALVFAGIPNALATPDGGNQPGTDNTSEGPSGEESSEESDSGPTEQPSEPLPSGEPEPDASGQEEAEPTSEPSPSQSDEAPAAAGAVSGLEATGGDGSVKLTWIAPDDREPTGYIVRWREAGEEDESDDDLVWSEPTATESADTTYTVDDLANGSTYVFQVAAVMEDTTGEWSAFSSAVTPQEGEDEIRGPSAPRNFTLTPGRGQVTVAWDAPTDDGGRPITGYILRWSSDDGATWLGEEELGPDDREFVITGLTGGGTFTIRLRATNQPLDSDDTVGMRTPRFASLKLSSNGDEVGGTISLQDLATLYVSEGGGDGGTCGAETDPCKTIQQAITNADPGDTISIAAGTYEEGLSIDKSLTLRGPYANVSPNDPVPSDPWRTADRSDAATIAPPTEANLHAIDIVGSNASEVSVVGLDLDLSGAGNSQRFINSSGSALVLTVTNSKFANAADVGGKGIWFLPVDGEPLTLQLTGNRFEGSGVSNGIRAWGSSDLDFIAESNVWVDNKGWAANLGTYLFESTPSTYRFEDNWVGNSTPGNGSDQYAARQSGLIINGTWSEVAIQGNSFLNVESSSVLFYTDYNGGSAYPFSGSATISNNAIIGYNAVYKPTPGSVEDAAIGPRPGGDPAVLTGVDVQDNSFKSEIDESVAITSRGEANTLDAASNWWGQTSGPKSGQIVNQDLVTSDPWIVDFVEDPAKENDPGFWPVDVVLSNQLSGLALSSGTLSPSFDTSTTEYTASVPNEVSSVTVTPSIVSNSGATVTVNGTQVTPGSPSEPIALAVGANTITTTVTYDDQVSTTYTKTVTRAASLDAGPPPGSGLAPTPEPEPEPEPTPEPTVVPDPVVEPVVVEDPEAVTPEEIEELSPEQVVTISPVVIRDLPPTAVAAFAPQQAAALTTEQVNALRPASAAALQPAAARALSPAQLGAMRPASAARLNPTAICTPVGTECVLGEDGLTAEQLAAFRPVAFGLMQPDQFEVMRPEQMTQLSQRLVNRIRPARARAMQPETVVALTPEQVAVLRPRSVRALRPEAIALLTLEQVAALRPEGVARMRAAQLERLSAQQVAALTAQQRAALSAQQRELLGLD